MTNNLGIKIKQLRLKRKLSQEDLAEKCSVSAAHINLVENGHKNPSLKLLIQVCKVLDTSPNYLLEINDSSANRIMHYMNALTPKQIETLEILVKTYIDLENNDLKKYEK